MSASHAHTSPAHDVPAPATRPALLAGLAVVMLGFWPTWPSYVATWLEMGEHSFLVAAFALWLAWRSRHRQLILAEANGVAAAGIALLSLLWLVGIVINIRLVHQAVVPLILLTWVFAVAGWRAALAAIPVAGTFLLAVPFWGAFSPPLQALTVAANGAMLAVAGIEARIEGTYIAIPSGVFEVAGACAGVKYLESGVIIAVAYGLLYLRSWRARAVAVMLAAGLSIVSNWIRVVGLIIVGHVTRMQSPLIADHDTYGWIIFAATLSFFFLLARRIEAYDQRLMPAGATDAILDAGARLESAAPWRRLTAPTLAALLGPALFLLGGAGRSVAPMPGEAIDGIAPGATFQLVSQEHVPPQDTAMWAPVFVGLDHHLRSRWLSGDGAEVRVDRLIYLRQAQGKELINELNELAADTLRLGGGLIGPLDERGRMVNATIVRDGATPRLVWSWYRVADVNTHSSIEGKLLELVGFMTTNTAAELVASSTRCAPDDCRAAADVLFRFVTGKPAPTSRGASPATAPSPP